jgi:enoyl-CoA hydratase/carnithine racemase
MELLLTGRVMSAQEAEQIGLLHRVLAPEEDLPTAALEWAMQLTALPREALAATKSLVQAVGDMAPGDVDRLEAELFRMLWSGADHLEALSAFVEKRKPRFNVKDGQV